MQALALLPRDGATLGIRRMFQPLEVEDPRLLGRLGELARRGSSANVVHTVEALVRSYAAQNGRCAICQRPTCLDPVPTIGPYGEIDDWCVASGPSDGGKTVVAHRLCETLRQEQDARQPLDDIQTQFEQLSAERRWLLALQHGLEEKKVEVPDGWESVEGLYDRYVRILRGLRSIVQLANEPPYSTSSRWQDDQKTLLEKRCHKTLCCDQWRKASDFCLRRPLKPGQIDSNDFFSCFCPHRGQPPQAIGPADAKIGGASDGGRVAGAVLAAHKMLDEEDAAGSKLGFAERRRKLAQMAYSTHRRLLPLYIGSDAKVVLPSPPPAAAPEQQWAQQGGVCAICKQKIELHEPLQWDLHSGAWCWMHSSCNRNLWKPYLAIRPLSELEEHRRLYRARQETDKLFGETIDKTRRSSSWVRIEVEKELLEALRQRATNLAEQALVQTRFSGAKALRPDVDAWIAELASADPDAAHSIALPPNNPPRPATTSRKRRRTS